MTHGAKIIDGKACAASLRAGITRQVTTLRERHGLVPGLAAVLVGDDTASHIYVSSKERQADAAGLQSMVQRLPAMATQSDLLSLISQFNKDDQVHGILIQLQLPSHIDADAVIDAIDPQKDVDGMHPINAGRLASGRTDAVLVPCTAQGCLLLLKTELDTLAGRTAVVVGRSRLVGRPLAHLLLNADCTVTVAHSRTRDLPDLCAQADILVAAVGRPEMVRVEWIKPGSVVIDVGINRVPAPTADEPDRTRLVGDVAFAEAAERAGAITPVPGGVGPMTIACLLHNTVIAACRQSGVALPTGG